MFLSPWQVSNWEKGTTYFDSTHALVYGQGNFHWGIEYQGKGFVVQEKFICLGIKCDKYGGYSRYLQW